MTGSLSFRFPAGALLLSAAALFATACLFEDEDEPITEQPSIDCAAIVSGTSARLSHGAVVAQPIASKLEVGVRTFTWDTTLRDLCVRAPISKNFVSYSLNVEPGSPSIVPVGIVDYGLDGLDVRRMTLTKTESAYKADLLGLDITPGTFGGESPRAAVRIRLQVSFPSRGSEELDLSYMEGIINEWIISWRFEKAPEGHEC